MNNTDMLEELMLLCHIKPLQMTGNSHVPQCLFQFECHIKLFPVSLKGRTSEYEGTPEKSCNVCQSGYGYSQHI